MAPLYFLKSVVVASVWMVVSGNRVASNCRAYRLISQDATFSHPTASAASSKPPEPEKMLRCVKGMAIGGVVRVANVGVEVVREKDRKNLTPNPSPGGEGG